MKSLGIIGGAGPLASSLFYETVIQECYGTGRPLPEIFLINFPFTRGLTVNEKMENEGIIRDELQKCFNTLIACGAKAGVMVCNTLHAMLASHFYGSIRFFSIPDMVLKHIQEQGAKRLLLLATQNTCGSVLYRYEGVELVFPKEDEQKIVDNAIDQVLEGKLCAEASNQINQLIYKYALHVDGVILGCTDLPVLHHHHPFHTELPIFDSVKIPAKQILQHL